MTEPDKFCRVTYKNWRGEVRTRRIKPVRLEYGSTQWHEEPQWLLYAICAEDNVEKGFALKDCNFLEGEENDT